MIVVDTSVLYALADRGDDWHDRVRRWYLETDESCATTPLVLAETDFLLRSRFQEAGVAPFHRDIAEAAYVVDWWPDAGRVCVDVVAQYPDLGLSLTDASLVALAARHRTIALATLDERHFRAVRPLTGEPAFRVLPADA